MGVKGLETYLSRQSRLIGEVTTFPRLSAAALASDTPTSLIIDGWAFIYSVYFAQGGKETLNWIGGGEYEKFEEAVVGTVKAWREVGFEVVFAFDGEFTVSSSRAVRVQTEGLADD